MCVDIDKRAKRRRRRRSWMEKECFVCSPMTSPVWLKTSLSSNSGRTKSSTSTPCFCRRFCILQSRCLLPFQSTCLRPPMLVVRVSKDRRSCLHRSGTAFVNVAATQALSRSGTNVTILLTVLWRCFLRIYAAQHHRHAWPRAKESYCNEARSTWAIKNEWGAVFLFEAS